MRKKKNYKLLENVLTYILRVGGARRTFLYLVFELAIHHQNHLSITIYAIWVEEQPTSSWL